MRNIVENNCGKVTVVERSDYSWGVIDSKGNEIVPFGKYDWIDGFEQGLCRVKIGKQSSNFICNDNKWGIIDENGKEVLPCEYDEVWNFIGKKRFSTRVVKNGVASEVYFHNLNPLLPKRNIGLHNYGNDRYYERKTYNDYNGTYVQDEMGWSDQDINDALDGEPDAYWNID